MKTVLFTSLLIINHLLLLGQTRTVDLSKVTTPAQAEVYINTHPGSGAKIVRLESGDDTSEILLPLYQQKTGFSFSIADYSYKIISIDSSLSFRVSYIYLDGSKLSKVEIDSLRQEIISKFKGGAAFFELATEYTMDGNLTGDTRWFTANMMVKEFEEAVRGHKQGEIFTVDIPTKNWYHVVLKTYNDTYIKQLYILKVKSKG